MCGSFTMCLARSGEAAARRSKEEESVAIQAGLAAYIMSTHRGHGHCIAKGVDIAGMVAELMGKATGSYKGKGGSMYIADVNKGMLGANGIGSRGGSRRAGGGVRGGGWERVGRELPTFIRDKEHPIGYHRVLPVDAPDRGVLPHLPAAHGIARLNQVVAGIEEDPVGDQRRAAHGAPRRESGGP
jgi:hypothetical protein